MRPDKFNEYWNAYQQFRTGLRDRPDSVISLEMHKAARVLGGTPVSGSFLDMVHGLESGRIHPDITEVDRRELLLWEARDALVRIGHWCGLGD